MKGHKNRKRKCCHYFNNGGECPFIENGCKFKHEHAGPCKSGSKCRVKLCQFKHKALNDKEKVENNMSNVEDNIKIGKDILNCKFSEEKDNLQNTSIYSEEFTNCDNYDMTEENDNLQTNSNDTSEEVTNCEMNEQKDNLQNNSIDNSEDMTSCEDDNIYEEIKLETEKEDEDSSFLDLSEISCFYSSTPKKFDTKCEECEEEDKCGDCIVEQVLGRRGLVVSSNWAMLQAAPYPLS